MLGGVDMWRDGSGLVTAGIHLWCMRWRACGCWSVGVEVRV